jgi:hypothetical protein
MSLAALDYPSPEPKGLEEWFFANLDSHQRIIFGAKQSLKVVLPLYQIYPVNMKDLPNWANLHQQQHNDMNAVLGLTSNDLTDVDFNDDRQRTAFYFLHLQEHRSALQSLGLGL